jgi:hypothetical protein
LHAAVSRRQNRQIFEQGTSQHIECAGLNAFEVSFAVLSHKHPEPSLFLIGTADLVMAITSCCP